MLFSSALAFQARYCPAPALIVLMHRADLQATCSFCHRNSSWYYGIMRTTAIQVKEVERRETDRHTVNIYA